MTHIESPNMTGSVEWMIVGGLPNMDKINGMYRHFKGNMYEVIGKAIHSETDEEMVVYKDKNQTMFVRPLGMFFEKVETDGKKVSRFKKLES